ncbi:MAG TPA: hypothetical protein VHQ65_09615 [Thermoanaerobaculia bacterium]|nr:hypothetical protein [Thermoanaerobaculia bacterium]
MRSKLTLLALTLMLACLPAAAGEMAAAPAVAPQAEAAAAPSDAQPADAGLADAEPAEAPAEEVTLDELLDSLSPMAGAEQKYICPDWGDCTNARDCWAHQAPRNCGFDSSAYACSNPTGKVCSGMCFCS